MSYEGNISQLGDTVNINSFPEFGAAAELAEDGTQDAAAVTATQVSLIANKQIVQDFVITRKAILQSLPMLEEIGVLSSSILEYARVSPKVNLSFKALCVPLILLVYFCNAEDNNTPSSLLYPKEARKLDLAEPPAKDRLWF